jgi:hypothetical protein
LLINIIWPVHCSDHQAQSKNLNSLLPVSTTSRKPGGLNFMPQAGKTKAHQCFYRCSSNMRPSLLFAAKAANNTILKCFVGK